MVTYPIHIQRHRYSGSKRNLQQAANEKNQLIADLESKINELLLKQTEPIKIYEWAMIARETGYSYETVRTHGMSIDGGSNGFTAWRRDLTYEQAMAMNSPKKADS